VQCSGSSCYKGRCLASTDALLQARWRVVRHFQHSSDDTRLLGSDCRWPSYAERQHFICRFNNNITNRAHKCVLAVAGRYTYGDRDVLSMPARFRRHVVGKTLRNICWCNIVEILLVVKLVIIHIFFINQLIEFYLNNAINLRPFTPHIMPCYTHKMEVVSWP